MAGRLAMTASRYAIGDRKFVEQVAEDLRKVEVNKGVYGDIVWPEGKHLTLVAPDRGPLLFIGSFAI